MTLPDWSFLVVLGLGGALALAWAAVRGHIARGEPPWDPSTDEEPSVDSTAGTAPSGTTIGALALAGIAAVVFVLVGLTVIVAGRVP